MGSKLLFITLMAVSLHRLSLALPIGGLAPAPHFDAVPVTNSIPTLVGDFKHPHATIPIYNPSIPVHLGKDFNPMGIGPEIESPYERFKDDIVVSDIAHLRILQLKNLESNMITKENANEWEQMRKSYEAIGTKRQEALETYLNEIVRTSEDRETLRGIRWSLKRRLPVWWEMDFIRKSKGQYQELIQIGDLLKFNDGAKLSPRYIIETIGPELIKLLGNKPQNKPLNLQLLAGIKTNRGFLIFHKRVTEVLETLNNHYRISGAAENQATKVETSPEKFLELLKAITRKP